jgi:hypothetical protein
MSDFETILRQRLTALDLAMPEPGRPVVVPIRRSQYPRGALVLLAAALGLLVIGAIGTFASGLPRDPAQVAQDNADEARVNEALGALVAGRCLSPAEAPAAVRAMLDGLGLSTWAIRVGGSADGVSQAPCVGGGASGETHEVILLPNMGPAAGAAIDRVSTQLQTECLGRDAAVNLLQSALAAAGVVDPRIEVTGVRGVPVGDRGAYLAHLNAGCYEYGGAAFDDVGRYTWYISGPGLLP